MVFVSMTKYVTTLEEFTTCGGHVERMSAATPIVDTLTRLCVPSSSQVTTSASLARIDAAASQPLASSVDVKAASSLASLDSLPMEATIDKVTNHSSSIYFSLRVNVCPVNTHRIVLIGTGLKEGVELDLLLDYQENAKVRKRYVVEEAIIEPKTSYNLRTCIRDLRRWTGRHVLRITLIAYCVNDHEIGRVTYSVSVPAQTSLKSRNGDQPAAVTVIKRKRVETTESDETEEVDVGSASSHTYSNITEFERAKSEALAKVQRMWDGREERLARDISSRLTSSLADITSLVRAIEKVSPEVRQKVINSDLLAALKKVVDS